MSLDGRLLDGHGREAPGQRGVALDLAVLGQRRGADHAQLTAGEHRLEHVRGVHRALGVAGAEHGVQLVDEQDDLALGVDDLLERRLEPLLELAAVLGAGDHAGQVERDDAGVAQRLGDVAVRRCAGPGPRRSAVLPTPASPISTALFLRRRARISTVCSISCSRPMTGSIRPARASAVRSRPNSSRAEDAWAGRRQGRPASRRRRPHPARPGGHTARRAPHRGAACRRRTSCAPCPAAGRTARRRWGSQGSFSGCFHSKISVTTTEMIARMRDHVDPFRRGLPGEALEAQMRQVQVPVQCADVLTGQAHDGRVGAGLRLVRALGDVLDVVLDLERQVGLIEGRPA